MECCCITLTSLAVLLVVLSVSYLRRRLNAVNFAGWHIIITGGSCGIGKAIAVELVKRGAKRVTIIARRRDVLEDASKEIHTFAGSPDKQTVDILALDVSDASECEKKLGELIEHAAQMQDKHGGLALFCSAGFSIPKRFLELEADDFSRLMTVNYFGSVNVVRSVLRSFKAHSAAYSNRLRLCLVSSVCGQIGLYAFTAYCGSKFALRGFAESLQYELLEMSEISHQNGTNLDARITIAHPPDTDTPGFATENQIKPNICRKLSEGAPLCSADHVARIIVEDTARGTFLSSVGVEGHLVTLATSGFSPCFSFFDAFVHAAGASVCRAVALVVLHFTMFPVVRKLAGQPEATSQPDTADTKKTR